MQKTCFYYFFLLILTCSATYSQSDLSDSLVFSVEDLKIYKSEFLNQYRKSNASSAENEALSIDEYAEMYINFKLKVQAAKDKGLDTMPNFVKEYGNYRKQLADKFISNGEVTEKMVKETYESMTTEVNVSHILITVPQNATPEDTLKAYNKAIDITKEIESGKNFNALALKYSDDKSVRSNKGEMGWFKAFKMVYPFERASYQLEVNEVSKPVRSQFGYHIIKKNEQRPSRGKISVAHIMKVNQRPNDSVYSAKDEIYKIYTKVNKGESFEDLAKQYSDHKATSENGGEMSAFEIGQLNSSIFEEKAFELNPNNPISQPFQTQFGWHIVKYLDEEPVADYAVLKKDIIKKIKTSDRSKRLIENIKQDLMEQYDVSINYELLSSLDERIDSSLIKYKWKYEALSGDDSNWLLKINDSSYMLDKFLKEVERTQRSLKSPSKIGKINEGLDNFTYTKLIQVHNTNLEEASPVFASEIKTYYEGLLMFDVMQAEVWKKTQEDSLGQLEYYNAHKNSFKSNKKVSGVLASTPDKKVAKRLKKDLSTKTLGQLKDNYPDVIFQEVDQMDISHPSLPKNLDLTLDTPKTYKYNSQFISILLSDYFPEQVIEFDNIKGEVISKLQEEREKEWLNELRNTYDIVINQDVLNTLQ